MLEDSWEDISFYYQQNHNVTHDFGGSSSLIGGDTDDHIQVPRHEYNALLAESGTSYFIALYVFSPYSPWVINMGTIDHTTGMSQSFSSLVHSNFGTARLANGFFFTTIVPKGEP